MSDCDEEKGCCATGSEGKGGDCCACGTDCGDCPVTCATAMWGCSFGKAMCEVQTELLKERIRKNWGPMLEKSADAVIEAFGAKFQAAMAAGKAKQDLQARLAQIMSGGK